MPSGQTAAAAVFAHSFRAISCDHVVLTTDLTASDRAGSVAERVVAELDAAASRFRPDSELSTIVRLAEVEDASVVVSPVLGSYLEAALHAADITDGLVDPTVGAAVIASGYDADIDCVRARGPGEGHHPRGRLQAVPDTPGWRGLQYDPAGRVLTLPRGTVLDLGASAKAHAADLIAAWCARRLPGGFLVNLGGDIAVSGQLPNGGWDVGVEDEHGNVCQVVVSMGQAIATSSTRRRTWISGGTTRHHIVDPRTGRTATAVWSQVTCVGVTAVEANAASTSAIVLGDRAPQWLTEHGIPARLERDDGWVLVTPGWPDPGGWAA